MGLGLWRGAFFVASATVPAGCVGRKGNKARGGRVRRVLWPQGALWRPSKHRALLRAPCIHHYSTHPHAAPAHPIQTAPQSIEKTRSIPHSHRVPKQGAVLGMRWIRRCTEKNISKHATTMLACRVRVVITWTRLLVRLVHSGTENGTFEQLSTMRARIPL